MAIVLTLFDSLSTYIQSTNVSVYRLHVKSLRVLIFMYHTYMQTHYIPWGVDGW